MPTIQCALSLLRPGQETEAHRHTSTVIYHAFRGSGSSFVGDERFDWEAGDSFVVPLWYPHRHVNRAASEEAILFLYERRAGLEVSWSVSRGAGGGCRGMETGIVEYWNIGSASVHHSIFPIFHHGVSAGNSLDPRDEQSPFKDGG